MSLNISPEVEECALALLQLRNQPTPSSVGSSEVSLVDDYTSDDEESPIPYHLIKSEFNKGIGLIKTEWCERGTKANGLESIKIPLEFNYDNTSTKIRHKSIIRKETVWVENNMEYDKNLKILKMNGANNRLYEYDMMSPFKTLFNEVTLKCVKYYTSKREKTPDNWPPNQYDWVIGTKETYYKLMDYLEQNYHV